MEEKTENPTKKIKLGSKDPIKVTLLYPLNERDLKEYDKLKKGPYHNNAQYELFETASGNYTGPFNLSNYSPLDFLQNLNGKTPLIVAFNAKNGKFLNSCYNLVQKSYLSMEGVIDTKKENDYGYTILHWAIVCYQSPEVIDNLITMGADVNALDKWDDSPAFLAIKYNHISGLERLIAKGADLSHVNNNEETPLSRAIDLERWDAVKMLMANHAKVYPDVEDGAVNPLYLAAKKGCDELLVQLLDKYGEVNLMCYPNHPDEASPFGMQSLIAVAALRGHYSTVQTLVEDYGAKINQKFDVLELGYLEDFEQTEGLKNGKIDAFIKQKRGVGKGEDEDKDKDKGNRYLTLFEITSVMNKEAIHNYLVYTDDARNMVASDLASTPQQLCRLRMLKSRPSEKTILDFARFEHYLDKLENPALEASTKNRYSFHYGLKSNETRQKVVAGYYQRYLSGDSLDEMLESLSNQDADTSQVSMKL